MVLWFSFIAHLAHFYPSSRAESCDMTTPRSILALTCVGVNQLFDGALLCRRGRNGGGRRTPKGLMRRSLPGELDERRPEIIRIRQIASVRLLDRGVLLHIGCHVGRVLRVQVVLRARSAIGSKPPIRLIFLLGADVDLVLGRIRVHEKRRAVSLHRRYLSGSQTA